MNLRRSLQSAFKAYEPSYLHIDVKYLPQMQDETKRRYRFVAIDRATRWGLPASRAMRPQPMLDGFCVTLKALARSASARF